MSCDDDCLQVGKGLLARELAEHFVDDVERCNVAVDCGAAGAPRVVARLTMPRELTGGEGVPARAAFVRRETRRDENGVAEGVREERGCEHVPIVIMGIS